MNSQSSAADVHNVIASVGNNENKTVLFAAMDEDIPYTQTSLHQRHLEIQGDEVQWRMAISAPIHYAATFASIGLVAKEIIGAGGYPTYQKTDKGSACIPLAGHLMDFSLAEKPSLLAFAGPTNTTSEIGVRPNQRRIEIMRLLLGNDGDPIRVSDIAESLNIGIDHAGSITDAMKLYDIVGKSSTGRGKPSLSYAGTPELSSVVLRQDIGSQLLFDVVKVLQDAYNDNPKMTMTNEDIARRLIDTSYPDMSVTQLIKKIAGKTNQLADKRGVLVAKRGISDAVTAREVVSADDKKLRSIAGYVSIVDGAIRNDVGYITTGKEKAKEIIASPTLVGKLIAKARKDSVGLKRGDDARRDAFAAVATILRTADAPVSKRDVQKRLLEQGVILDTLTVSKHLAVLIDLGRASVREERNGFVFSRTPQDD